MAERQAETIGRICAALLQRAPEDQLTRLVEIAIDVGAEADVHGETGTAIHRLVRSIYRAVREPADAATN